MGFFYKLTLELMSESSFLLFWLGGWNLICLVLPDDSILICFILITLGIVFRVLFYYASLNETECTLRRIDCLKDGNLKDRNLKGNTKRKKRRRLIYFQIYKDTKDECGG